MLEVFCLRNPLMKVYHIAISHDTLLSWWAVSCIYRTGSNCSLQLNRNWRKILLRMRNKENRMQKICRIVDN